MYARAAGPSTGPPSQRAGCSVSDWTHFQDVPEGIGSRSVPVRDPLAAKRRPAVGRALQARRRLAFRDGLTPMSGRVRVVSALTWRRPLYWVRNGRDPMFLATARQA